MMKPDETTVWAAVLLENSDFYLFMYFAVNAISLWLLFFPPRLCLAHVRLFLLLLSQGF